MGKTIITKIDTTITNQLHSYNGKSSEYKFSSLETLSTKGIEKTLNSFSPYISSTGYLSKILFNKTNIVKVNFAERGFDEDVVAFLEMAEAQGIILRAGEGIWQFLE